MTDRRARDALVAVLDARREAAQPATLWLRDDDACEATPALASLLDLAGFHGVAPVIAAIPERARPSLIEALAGSRARLAVHGAAHRNHAPAGEKKRELGPDRPLPVMLAELRAAHRRLADLAGDRFLPMLVPPWNRIAPGLVPRLAGLGFAVLSTFGPRPAGPAIPGLSRINTHVDLIDWRGGRKAHPPGDLYARLARAVGAPRPGRDDEPIGILSHHLVHDDAAWAFLNDLMALTTRHPGARWLDAAALVTSPQA